MASTLVPASLHQADRTHILAAMAGFRNQTADTWLGPAHPISAGSISPISWAAASALPPARLIEATAASAPNHCLDGWSYVSRAISSLVAGDGHACRHLAYYAQLRAGISMLANLGVGVFNKVNFAITAAGGIQRIDTSVTPAPRALGLGTHEIVWEALKAWSSNNASAAIFLKLIKIRGTSIADCLEALWPGGSFLGAAGSLVENWGLDLKRGRDEHRSRNISSYSPQVLNPVGVSPAESLSFVAGFWRLFEPTSSSSFDKLDRFLLRRVLQSQHRAVTGNSRYTEGPIHHRYDELPPLVRTLAARDFLTGRSEKRNPELLRRARATSSPSLPIEMMARAFLLLRAATALTHSSFVEAGVNFAAGDTRPWIDKLAEERGFWAPGAALPDPMALWDDVELALIDFDASINPAPTCWNDWMVKTAKGLPVVSEAERIGVWSLGA